jgi:hypothetical protein
VLWVLFKDKLVETRAIIKCIYSIYVSHCGSFHLVKAVDSIAIVISNENLCYSHSLRLGGNNDISAEGNVFPCEFVYGMMSEGHSVHM